MNVKIKKKKSDGFSFIYAFNFIVSTVLNVINLLILNSIA